MIAYDDGSVYVRWHGREKMVGFERTSCIQVFEDKLYLARNNGFINVLDLGSFQFDKS